MKIFKYLYRDADGMREKMLLANTKDEALEIIHKKPLTIISVREVNLFSSLSRLDELENIFWQLGFGINSGLGLLDVLKSIKDGLYFKEHIILLDSILTTLNGGENISVALKKHPKICGNLVIVLFEIGEKTGKMYEMCQLCAIEIRQKNEFRQSLLKALSYPLLLIISCLVAFVILAVYVVPSFSKVYSELDSNLPLSTRYIINVSDFISNYAALIIIFFTSLAAVFLALLSQKRLKDRILINMPIINRILLDYELYRYFLGLYYFLTSRVDFLSSIKLCNSLIDNAVLKNNFKPVVDYLNGGYALSYAFSHIDVEIANISLLKSGEDSGAFDKTLKLNYEFYKKRYTKALQTFSVIIEPLITILMGLFITFLAFSVVSPMWKLLEIAI